MGFDTSNYASRSDDVPLHIPLHAPPSSAIHTSSSPPIHTAHAPVQPPIHASLHTESALHPTHGGDPPSGIPMAAPPSGIQESGGHTGGGRHYSHNTGRGARGRGDTGGSARSDTGGWGAGGGDAGGSVRGSRDAGGGGDAGGGPSGDTGGLTRRGSELVAALANVNSRAALRVERAAHAQVAIVKI